MLEATAHNAGIHNLAGTVINLTLAHVDNALAQSGGGFFQLLDFTSQLLLGLGQASQSLLSPAIHTVNLGQLSLHRIVFPHAFLHTSV